MAVLGERVRIKVMCGDYTPYSPFLEVSGGCGHGYDGTWEIDGPQDLQCPSCGRKLDRGTLEMLLPTVEAERVMGIGGSDPKFLISRRTREPYFAAEEEDIA